MIFSVKHATITMPHDYCNRRRQTIYYYTNSKKFCQGGTEQMEKSTQEENAVLNTTLID